MDFRRFIVTCAATLAGLALGIFGGAQTVHALPWVEEARLTASDAHGADQFGWTVGISGNTILIGAPQNDDCGSDSGSAYVFEKVGGTWTEIVRLLASDGHSADKFGLAVGISGNCAIVGAPQNDDCGSNCGSAYIFEQTGSGWLEAKKLLASDAHSGDWFGLTVGISGNCAIVGAPQNDDCGGDSGSAYIFERDGGSWTEAAKLLASDGHSDDEFGLSVAIDGTRAIVGACYNDDCGSSSGSAYIFEKTGGAWTQVTKLLASDAASSDLFGISVGIAGDFAIVGAPQNDDCGTSSGSAYLFHYDGSVWTEIAKLIASDAHQADKFGYAVSIGGNVALVGAYQNDDNGSNSGSAYIFEDNGTAWNETWKLLASGASASDQFGCAVSVDGSSVVVGAFNEGACADPGAAYVFTPVPEPATMSLVMLGVAAAAFIRRRRPR